MTQPDTLDLVKPHPEAYRAGPTPDVVDVGRGTYLTLTGEGAPDGLAFGAAVAALYAVAYSVKFACKELGRNFKVAPLEASWWVDEPTRWAETPREQWCWEARIRVPDFVDEEQVDEAEVRLAAAGKEGPVDRVLVKEIDDGPCVRVLHVGPYSNEMKTIVAMHHFAEEAGYTLLGRHHEVYLSDPRRTRPERLRTVLRHPVVAP